MHVYRFRLLLEEQDDFLRDIEIKPSQTFKDFHDIVQSCTGIKGNELASFFICDNRWHKTKEITLIDMGMDAQADDLDDEDVKRENEPIPVHIMDQVKLKDLIEDPHQRLVYEYDFLNPRTFYIELTKIVEGSDAKTYPVCVRQEGTLSASAAATPFYLDDPDDEAMLGELNDMIKDGTLEEEIDENFTTEPEW